MSLKKTCTRCKKNKNKTDFYSISGKLHFRCKDCCKDVHRLRMASKYADIRVEDLDGEVWVDINERGFNGLYMVSNFGRVKALPRRTIPYEHLINPSLQTSGRYAAAFTNNGHQKSFLLHRLIAKAFIKNPKRKPCINHINNIPTDNRIENLEWCTHKENSEHAKKCGRMQKGSARHNSVFNEQQVLEIFQSSLKQRELAVKYGVSKSAISLIKCGRNWSHLTGKYAN